MTIGSSPRMWGILHPAGIEPAPQAVHPHACGVYQGEELHGKAAEPVHPHACGVYGCLAPLLIAVTGSSPRMWGIRTTPTLFRWATPVHPHACGVYGLNRCEHILDRGSSPRMWGILRDEMAQITIFDGSSPRMWGIRNG